MVRYAGHTLNVSRMANKAFNIDISPAVRKLNAMGKTFKPSVINTALARSINRTSAMAQTQSSREIRRTYRIKKKDLDKSMKPIKAFRTNPVGGFNAFGTPIPLMYFNPKQTKKGVAVNITGKRKVIEHAFIATMPVRYKDGSRMITASNNRGVFMRGSYKANGFEYKPGGRLPITKLVTVSQGVMLKNPNVMEKTLSTIEDQFPKRLKHEIDFLMAGLAGSRTSRNIAPGMFSLV